MANGEVRPRTGLMVAAAIAGFLLFSGQGCPSGIELAFNEVERQSSSLLAEMGAKGWRVHIYPEQIPANSVVASFSLTETGTPSETLTCEGSCYLVFIDTQPLHHFAHPTVIGLYDVEHKRVEGPIKAEWWPTIDGNSVFNTVISRREGLFRDSENAPFVPYSLPVSGTVGRVVFSAGPTIPKVWAVIVNGYYDPSDTFDEDTYGMQSVLQGLGIPEDHIELLRPPDPNGTVPAAEQASVANLKTALEHVKVKTAMTDSCDDFLLFYSAHGTTNNLACGTDPNHATTSGLDPCDVWLCAKDLKDMLEVNVGHCKNVTVVIEACKSGSILNHFTANLPGSPPFRSQPSQKPWQMFVSAAADDTSAGDVDTEQDDNVADAGSETIWGYVEAFGSVTADGDHNGWIDFREAVDYAQAMDATENHDGIEHFSGTPTSSIAVHGSDLSEIGGQPQVEFIGMCDSSDVVGAALVEGTITRCCDAALKLKVSNSIYQKARMPFALRVFRPQSDTDWEPYYPASKPEAYMSTTVIIPGLDHQAEIEVQVDLGEVPKALKKGDSFLMKAVVDHLENVDQETEAVSAPLSGDPKNQMKLKVDKCFLNWCCWWTKDRCPK